MRLSCEQHAIQKLGYLEPPVHYSNGVVQDVVEQFLLDWYFDLRQRRGAGAVDNPLLWAEQRRACYPSRYAVTLRAPEQGTHQGGVRRLMCSGLLPGGGMVD